MLCRFCVDQNLLRRPSLSLSRSLKDKEMTSLARREILRRCFSASATSGGKKTVGFVGAGNMGKFMAKNLVEAGYAVRVFDVSSDAVNECVAFGAVNWSYFRDAKKSRIAAFVSSGASC